MDFGHEDDRIVLRSRFWSVAGQRGPVGTRRMLLGKPIHEAIW